MAEVKKKEPVPDPWPAPPAAVVLAAAGIAHVIITAGAVIAISSSNGSRADQSEV